MDSYIVRVYRRGQGKSDEIVGLVEQVGSSQRSSFHTLEGLISTVKQVVGHKEQVEASVTQLSFVDRPGINLKK